MKSFYKVITVAFLVLFSVQCEVVDSDLLDSPNAVSPENVNPDFLLNNIQLDTRSIYSGSALRGSQLTRQRRLFGSTYESAYSSQDLDGVYDAAYANVFIDTQTLLPLAEENQLYFHMGMAQTLQAYGMLTMVDLFGDVPMSEALDATNFNPQVDDGAAIYDSTLTLLDTAIANLTNEDRATFPNDLYYPDESGQDKVDAWVRAANTLKLKAYVNMRHVDPDRAASGINALLDDPIGVIDEDGEDFTFDYSTNDTNPDSRHPLFTNNYLNGANDYLGIGFMNILLNDRSMRDPRIRYFIYRQTVVNSTDPSEQSCQNANRPSHYIGADPFCQFDDHEGYWGNGHLNTEGIPPDQFGRSTFGVYPAGGEFDNSQSQGVEPDMGYQGAGFRPILMAAFTHFLLAEAALELDGVALDARQLLQQGVEISIESVMDYGSERVAELEAENNVPSEETIDDYIDEVLAEYDAGEELRTIAVEFYKASFPNGMEAYNSMRRTGFPARADGIQAGRNSDVGDFYRTLPYPAALINRNSSVSAKSSNLVRTFWDTRGDDTEFNF